MDVCKPMRMRFLHNRIKGVSPRRSLLLLASAVAAALTACISRRHLPAHPSVRSEVRPCALLQHGRGDEEIPLEMVDLDRTKGEVADRESQLAADAKAEAEERAAEKRREASGQHPHSTRRLLYSRRRHGTDEAGGFEDRSTMNHT